MSHWVSLADTERQIRSPRLASYARCWGSFRSSRLFPVPPDRHDRRSALRTGSLSTSLEVIPKTLRLRTISALFTERPFFLWLATAPSWLLL